LAPDRPLSVELAALKTMVGQLAAALRPEGQLEAALGLGPVRAVSGAVLRLGAR